MAHTFDVVAVGMINFDINAKTFDPGGLKNKVTEVDEIALGLGGDAQNCAFTLARLGLKTAVCGAVGSDMAGDICLRAQRAAGIDTSMVIRKPVQTGIAIQLFQTAEASVLNCGGANMQLGDGDIPDMLYGSAKVASLNSFFGCGSVGAGFLRRARESGMITVADTTTLMPGDGIGGIRAALRHLDYFLPSYAEARTLANRDSPADIAAFFRDLGVGNVVIKLGAEGCFVKSGLAEKTVKGYNVTQVVDTTGCGDNFVAGFIAGLANGCPIEECAELANAAGAINASQLGSNGAVKSFDQLIRFRDGNKL